MLEVKKDWNRFKWFNLDSVSTNSASILKGDKRNFLTQEVHDNVEISWHGKQKALEDVFSQSVKQTTGNLSATENNNDSFLVKTTNIYYCWWNVLTYCSFVAYTALHHMLVRLALHRYGTLTDPAKDDGSAAAIWTALRGVWRRGLTWYQSTGERCQTLG